MESTDLFEDQAVDEPKQLATVPPSEAPRNQLADLRQFAMAIAPEDIEAALTQYSDRRDAFRKWLESKLERGLHYGVPPGVVQNEVDPEKWRHKPSLYKAGAEFVVDLMGLRPAYEADLIGWQQLGSKPGMAVIKCRLFSKTTDKIVGEGIGAGKAGEKKRDENGAIKIAQKSALIAAVLNAYGLSDLFTQDLDRPPPHDNPPANPKAPKAAPRNKPQVKANPSGVTMPDVSQISAAWKRDNKSQAEDKQAFADWVFNVTERDFDCRALSAWTRPDVTKCLSALGLEPRLASDPSDIPF